MEHNNKTGEHEVDDLTERIDACFKTLLSSPSEKTVQTAKKLEGLFKEWRDACIQATMNNMVNVTNELVKNLETFGVRFLRNPEHAPKS